MQPRLCIAAGLTWPIINLSPPGFHAYGLNQDQQSKLLIVKLIITSFVLVLEIISIVTFEFEFSSTIILRVNPRLTTCFLKSLDQNKRSSTKVLVL